MENKTLIALLKKDGFNFDVDGERGELTVIFKSGYIVLPANSSKRAFLDLFELYMMGHDAPGIVRIPRQFQAML